MAQYIELFEIQDKIAVPTKHCYTIKWLKIIMDVFPKTYTTVYAYLYYMTYPGKANPFYNLPITIKENMILDSVGDIDTEDDNVISALTNLVDIYSTPTTRAHEAIKTMLDNINDYISTANVTAGKDGNINSLIKIAKEFDSIRQSYKGVVKDLEDEQETVAKGGQSLAYDQM